MAYRVDEEPDNHEDNRRVRIVGDESTTEAADDDECDDTDRQQHCRSPDVHTCQGRDGRAASEKEDSRDHQ